MTAPDRPRGTIAGAVTGDIDTTPCDEVNIVVSDMHLGEGRTILVPRKRRFVVRIAAWVRRGFRREARPDLVEIVNPLEDFPFDVEFAAFLTRITEQFRDAGTLRLRLMGDVFDPLAVSMHGRFIDPPYETVGLYKMRKIMRGHEGFFDALAEFLRSPNARIDIFAGNHDLFLVWPKVQQEVVRRLVGDDPALEERIRFIDHHRRFEDGDRGVLYYHGMNAEPHNTCLPEQVVLTHRFGADLKRPVLNMPYGSYMTMGLVNRLKMRNRLVGRMREDRQIWTHAVRFRWGWGLYAGFVLLWHFIYSQLFAFWDIRRKSSFRTILATVLSTTTKNPVDIYAARLLKEREDVRVVVMGHSHNWKRASSESGTYLNTGSWALTYRLEEPKFELRWKRFRRLELVWRSAGHFLKTGELPFFTQLRKVIGYLAVVTAMIAFLAVHVPAGADFTLGDIHLVDLKLPIGVALCFLLVGGVFRFFAAKPSVVDDTKFTFGLVRHYANGDLKAEVMEFDPVERSVKECV